MLDEKVIRNDRIVCKAGEVLMGLGLLDLVQSLFTGHHFYEIINPGSVPVINDAIDRMAIGANGLALDAIAISVGSHCYNSSKAILDRYHSRDNRDK